MKLYHGTNAEFDKIVLEKSRLGKDFGIGFYLTPDKAVAKRQAERKYVQFGTGNISVQTYEWNNYENDNLRILSFDGYSIEWAEFILLNRRNKCNKQLHNYDVVIGPIADDTVGFQIRRFEDGIITMQQFVEEIKYHTVTMQYLFATENALKTLKRL